MLRLSKRHSGFIMAEIVVALTILTSSIVLWGGTEYMMQQREQASLLKIQMAREHYESIQLKGDTVKVVMQDGK
ncbi:hypothetical protein ACFP3T_05315 [Lactiplantibacillus dongliensis]|uniref:Type II secretion system protein n=1 Tax=Lactiplantibacillus dongliensis TaxID=2559919 RepID=A0ABW1R5D6_9LACO|nr:hypothetical protein [Lactiplantibacillus dongliensis]